MDTGRQAILSTVMLSHLIFTKTYRVDLSFGNSEKQMALLIVSMQIVDTIEGITCWVKKINSGKETQQTRLLVFMIFILLSHHVTQRSETA